MSFIEDETLTPDDEALPEEWLSQVFDVERHAPRSSQALNERGGLPVLVMRSYPASG